MLTVKETVSEVVYAVMPITVLVIILQFAVIGLPISVFLQFIVGVVMVSAGLIFFLLGVHLGLLPIGEMVGAALPKTGKLWLVVLFGLLLGFVITVAEPDVRVLALQVDMVSDGVISRNILIVSVALGVAVFVGLAMLRIIWNISLNKLLIGGYSLVLFLTLVAPPKFVPISLDAGGVTTGPMAVPFILALGVGVSSVLAGRTSSADGFGLVALASIGPVLAVLLLGVIYF